MQTIIKNWQGHSGKVLDTVNEFDVINCAQCGFKHVIPIPTGKQLEEIYRHEYYTQEKPLYIERFKEDLEWWNLAYADRYDTFEDQLLPEQRRILDIGSGTGYFLKHGKNRGWITLGIEPSQKAAAHSRSLGIDIIESFLDETVANSLEKFDVIHMSEVLEHIPDPSELLRIANEKLNPGGIICIVVPNDYSPVQHTLRTTLNFNPWWVAPPHHLNYFDRDSLCQILNKQNFQVVFAEATFPIDFFLLMGENYVGNDELGRACHQKRKTFELNLNASGFNEKKRALYRAMADLDIGREICIYAKK